MNTVVDPSPIIREITTIEELRAVERLQKDVWGLPDFDVVPLYHLVAAQNSGGVLLGAFDGDNLVGFVYGFVGRERGRIVHHSHMLGVCPGYRTQKLGFRLKCEQRKYVMDQGIDTMTWTFDPLRSLNAYFNFRKLGVVADRYYRDFYGNEASSFLHQNGTDRFWVTWHLAHPRVIERIEGPPTDIDISSLPVLVAVCETGAPIVRDLKAALRSPKFVIEIPGNIGAVETENPEMARSWRAATNDAFSNSLEAGFVVEDFIRVERAGQAIGAYLLSNDTGLSIW